MSKFILDCNFLKQTTHNYKGRPADYSKEFDPFIIHS
jgi:hypothetical protein